MKRILCMLVLAALSLAPCLAEDSDLEARVKSLEETVDQMKQDKATAQDVTLKQKLDWGKGWGFDVNSGTMQNAPEIGLDVLSPLLFKSFRIELTCMTWLAGNYPEPITHPDVTYSGAGMLGGVRVSYYSPLMLNFARLYGGLVADFYLMRGSEGAFSFFDPAMPHQKTAFVTEMFYGMEFFVTDYLSSYVEIVSDWAPFFAKTWVSEEDARFFNALDAGPGHGGVTLKVGFRFYP